MIVPQRNLCGYPQGTRKDKLYFVWHKLQAVTAYSHGYKESFGDVLLTPWSFYRTVEYEGFHRIPLIALSDEEEELLNQLMPGVKEWPPCVPTK